MFVTLVDAGSFRSAAEQLFISQPALSQQINRLETDLGLQLIDRSQRPVRLTAAGREFHIRCRDVLDQVTEIESLMSAVKDGTVGRVRLGLASALMYGHVPSAVKVFREAFPRVEVEISNRVTTQVQEELEEGRLDVAILFTRSSMKGLTSRRLYSEPYRVALPIDHPLAGEECVTFSQLREESVIMIPRHAAPENHDALIVACMQADFSPRGPVVAGSYLDHVALTSAGFGVSFVPESLTRLRLDNVVYKPIGAPTVEATISISWFQDRANFAARAFVEHFLVHYHASPTTEGYQRVTVPLTQPRKDYS